MFGSNSIADTDAGADRNPSVGNTDYCQNRSAPVGDPKIGIAVSDSCVYRCNNGSHGIESDITKIMSITTNKHCVLTGKETVVIEDRPVPKCGSDQVLVHVMATGM
jgi:hypothetical protein